METSQAPTNDFDGRFGALLRELRLERRLRQIELAVEIPVDHSLISRWETGTVLPSGRDLDQICTVLGLGDEAAERLRYAWRRERNAAAADQEASSGDRVDWVDSLRLSVDCVRALRKGGQPRVALLLSRRDALHSLDYLRSHVWRPSHAQALSSLSELLLEECKAGLDYLPQAAVRGGYLDQTLRAQALAVAGAGEPNASLFRAIATEGVAYVSGNIGDAHAISRKLLADNSRIPAEWLPEVVRACAINAGKLGDIGALNDTEEALQTLINERDDLPPGTHAFVLEGLARGWSSIEPQRALEVIEMAWQTRSSSDDSEASSSLRFVQLVRSQAEVELALHCRGNLNDTAAKIERAIDLSKQNEYDKYTTQLDALAHRLI